MALGRPPMKWRDFVDFAKTNARERRHTFTSADADWPITIITDFPDEEPHAFDLPGWVSNSVEARRGYAEAMGLAARMKTPTKIAMVASTWQVSVADDEPDPGVPPSRHPDRFEAVIVVVADAEIEEGWSARVKRRRYGPPLLGEWEGPADELAGAMFEPWRDALR
jgi:hypothetical protein